MTGCGRLWRAVLLAGGALVVHGQDAAAIRRAMEPGLAAQLAAAAAQEAAATRQRQSAQAYVVPPVAGDDCEPLVGERREAVVGAAAARGGLPAALLRAVIERESGFRPCAVSPRGAQGLMQLMPATARELGVRNAFDPVENASFGARFLRGLLARYGDLSLALGAYNAGAARVDSAGGVPDIPETRAYVRAILAALEAPGGF